jgi:hypothetical protein
MTRPRLSGQAGCSSSNAMCHPPLMGDTNDRHKRGREWILFLVALAGLVLGVLNFIRDSPPRPPILAAEWTASESDYVAWVPPISGTNDGHKNEWTREFPVPIAVTNFGELTAKRVELSITHPANIALMSDQFEVSYQQVKGGGTEPLVQTRISLGDLDPGEATSSLTSLYAITENTIDMSIETTAKGGVPMTVGTSVGFVLQLQVQLTAEDTPPVTQSLSLAIGTPESFREADEPFCQIKRGDVICA